MNLLPKFKEYLFSPPRVDESSESRRDRTPLSKITVKNYLSDIFRFIKWFEVKFNSFSPESVTPQVIEQFKQSNNLTMSSLERNLSSLRKFFNFLVLEGIISESPFKQSNNETIEQSDPYKLKEFKNYLYVYNASKLTIKNYLMDVKGFLKWAEEVTNSKNAWDVKETALSKIDNYLIEEYKRRLVQRSLGEVGYSPRTINRKLSSLRKYLKWAVEEGLIPSERFGRQSHLLGAARLSVAENLSLPRSLSQIRQTPPLPPSSIRYSKFPPFRLVQKTARGIVFLPEFVLIGPLASLARSAEHLIWKLRGKPVFDRVKSQKPKIKSLPKEVFAPFAISTKYLPLHRKLIFHLAHTRPQWYKKYHSYSFSHYFHLGILIVFMSALGFGIYQNTFSQQKTQGVLGFANPQVPPRILSFQGRLTDSSDNPITSSTNLRFALYDSPTGTGSALLWQEIDTVAPDSDGIFSLLLGNRTTMSQSLFAERAGLWLGVTVGQTKELEPRQRLATVAYAENADNLQGLPPITQSGAGTTNVVLALNSSGNLAIGGTATPAFEATGGKFTLSGKVLSLVTVAGTNSNIEIKPDGLGKIDLQKPLQNSTNNNNVSSALGAVEFDDLVAILATSSGQSAFTVNQNGAGPILSASSSGTAKFTLSNAGAGEFAGDLAVNGGDITSTQTTFNLLNSTVTTLNVGGAATTINLGATSGTTTTANSLTILGNTTLGDTAADTITLTGALNSNFLPDANNTRNLGSSALRFGTVFGVNGDFTNISGTITGGSTTNSSWTINSDNTTANAEVGSLAFETGTANFNAVLQWNALGDAGRIAGFDNANLFNFPIGIFSQVSGANQSFTSGTLFKYGQPAAHAITQSAAFIGTDYDFSSNITVPNSASGNQTGYKTTLKDGGASATAIGFQTAGTLDYGIDLGGTIGTAEIRLSNGETITNTTDGTVSILGADIAVTAGKGLDVASAGALGVGNTTATTVNIGNTAGTTLTLGSGGALTRTISIGTGTGADTINIGTGTVTADTISIGGLASTVIATTGTLTHTGTANINTSGSATTAIGNSTGSLTLASGGTSSWTNTSGNLTIQTATSGTLVLDSIGALNIGNTNATSLSIGRTGVTTTNNGALTSTQTLTASNGLTLTTGALNLTGTSGSIALTGYGTASITSTTASGNILTLADSSLTTTGANLANLTFTNTNAGAGAVTTNGLSITPTGTVVTGGGSNTLNAINLPNVTAIASNTFNALNFGTGYTNFINSGTVVLTAAGALSGITGYTQASGNFAISGTGTLSTGTGAVSLNGDVTIAAGKNLTLASGTGVHTQTFTGTTTNPFVITASAITTGNVVDLSNTSTTATSSDLIQGDHTATYTTATTVSGNLLDLSRTLTINAAATTLTVSGAVATISDNCTVTAGTCTNTANILSLTQSYANASGAVLAISNSGTGVDILGTSSTWQVTKAGAATFNSTLSVGTNPATTGVLRLQNSGATLANGVYFRNNANTGNINALSVDDNDRTWLGYDSGTTFLATNATARFFVNSTGFMAQTDNTLDIGASGATRPRTLYLTNTIEQGGVSVVAPVFHQRYFNGGALNSSDIIMYLGGQGSYNSAPSFNADSAIIKGIATQTFTSTAAGSKLAFFTTSNNSTTATERWDIAQDGTLMAFADNTYDIGASGATRPRSIYLGTLTAASATTVCRDANGGLSTCSSSRQFKDNINYLSDNQLSDILGQITDSKLATFTYKTDRPDLTRYGLIAEEAPFPLRMIDSNGNPNIDFYSAQFGYTWAGIKALNQKLSAIFKNSCVSSQSSADFGLIKTICSQSTIEKLADSTTYAVKNYLGEVATGGQILAEAVIGNLRAGLVQTQELIADTINVNNKIISPVAEVQLVKTDIITPLSSDKVVIKLTPPISHTRSVISSDSAKPRLEIQNASGSAVASIDDEGNASFSGQLSSKSLNSEEATVSGTLKTKNLIAENIDTAILNIKNQISNITTASPSASPIPITGVANVDTLNAQVGTFMQGLFAVGPTSLSDATVFGQLSVGGSLTLADNSINVLGTDLQIQPLKQGGVSFLAGKVRIDAEGNLEVNGDAKFNGTLFANLISPIPDKDLVIRLGSRSPYGDTASDSAKFVIQNASGSAVLTVNSKGDITASGSAKFNDFLAKTFSIVREAQADTSLTETIASSSAGFAIITAGETERTIITPFVKEDSLIYLTPTSDTQGETTYIARQTLEDLTLGTKASFTIGISKALDQDIKLNWWIVN